MIPSVIRSIPDQPMFKNAGKEHVHSGKKKSGKRGKSSLIPESYLNLGSQALASQETQFRILLEDRKWPQDGWSDLSIQTLMNRLAAEDSNNFVYKSGVGEREGRVYSSLVAQRHYNMSHGVGRSGDLGELQPKAIGSSILGSLTNALVLDLCRLFVSRDVKDAFLVPLATGMSISLVLLTLKARNPIAKYVIWPRLDQKSCFKSICTSGLIPIIVQGDIVDGEIRTNLKEIEAAIDTHGSTSILCVLSTTSCFAPRACDSLKEIAVLCSQRRVHHIVNNAYGLQSSKCCHFIQEAQRLGRLDVFVQSTDKNLMVPVGGAIIAGFDESLVEEIRKCYPGRASSSQAIDVLITMLSMGKGKYKALLEERSINYTYLKQKMVALAQTHGENVIETPNNKISIGFTLKSVGTHLQGPARFKLLTELGSMLFHRNIFGARVVTCQETNLVDKYEFRGWGAHHTKYPTPYLTAAATIGMTTSDVDLFIKKLGECLTDVARRRKK